jgi:hypothetical protein
MHKLGGQLLLVSLDLVGGALARPVRVGAGVTECVSLPELVPQLVESHLETLESGSVLGAQPVRILPEPVLLLDERTDTGSDLAVVHALILAGRSDRRH